jgi:Predicted Fe-S oxidoreductases
MQFDNKKIIIYGKNRYQRDFQYIFPDLNIAYYIDDKEQEGTCPITTLNNELSNGVFVIICKSKEEQSLAIQSLQANSLQYGDDFCIMDDLFTELDFNIERAAKGKKIVVWGTGFRSKQFCESYHKNYENLVIDFFIDSDPEKCKSLFYDKEVVYIDSITDWNSYFVIIAIADENRDELNKIIAEKGFQNNCVPASLLLREKPSSLLFRTIYDVTQYEIAKCPKIDDIRILWDGNVCPCGSSQSIVLGNIFIDKPEEIWNSVYVKIYRLSMLNRTHTFCEGHRCPHLVNRKVNSNEANEFKLVDNFPKQPYLLLLDLEGSCNIMCTSCRDSIIVRESAFYDRFCDSIIENYLDCSDRLIFAGNSEVFVSKYGKRILKSVECIKRQHVSLLTNGLAFNRYNWNEYLEPYKMVDVSVSIDAATEETYLKIRRKSNWIFINENLKMIQELKAAGRIGFFQINFVVQKMNVHEMADFVRMGKKYQVDRVLFNMLENWKFSPEEFREESIMDENNNIKEEYKKYFEDEILFDSIVDLTNIAQAFGKHAKDAYMY